MLKRSAKAQWQGSGHEGKGTLQTMSGALSDTPYSFASRFKNEDGRAGTNPEELIAAAHSGCFNMALAVQLEAAGMTAESIVTNAVVLMDQVPGGFAIQKIQLNVEAKISGISEEKFQEIAEATKANCPVSKALAAIPIEMTARLIEQNSEMTMHV
jgi:osmotically inducible protein OsmC